MMRRGLKGEDNFEKEEPIKKVTEQQISSRWVYFMLGLLSGKDRK